MNNDILNDLIACKYAISNIKTKINDNRISKKIIKTLIEKDCPIDLLSLISDTKFNFGQICEIINGFEDGLSFEEISVYANHNLNEDSMYNIRRFIKSKSKNYSLEEIHKYCGDKGLSLIQLDIVKEGLEAGLSEEEVDIYANKCFNCDQMRSIKNGLKAGLGEKVKIYAHKEIDSGSTDLIVQALLSEISEEKINKIYSNRKFDNSQKEIILRGLLSGLSEDEINIYASQDFNSSQMEVIYDNLINNTDRKLIQIIANPYFSSYRMECHLSRLKNYDNTYIDLILTKHSMSVINDMCYEESYRKWLSDMKEQEILRLKKQINDYLSEFNKLYHKNKPLKIKFHGDLNELSMSVTLPKYIHKYEKRVKYLDDILCEFLRQNPSLHDYEIIKTKDRPKVKKCNHEIPNFSSKDIMESYLDYKETKEF